MTNQPPYRIIVMTSDKYLHALLPYAHLLNKYWLPNPRVLIAGFSPPPFKLPVNFEFLSLGSFTDYPFQSWSNAFIKLLNTISDEAFVLMLEDYWIIRPVDTHAVHVLFDYIIQFKYVMKIDLCADRLYAHGADLYYGNVSYLDLIKSMPGSPYHLSLMTGLWRREHLLKHIIPNESPHDVEMAGTTRVSHDQNIIILGTRQWPCRNTLAFRAGDSQKLLLDELKPSDVEEMTELGFLKPWGIG